MLHASMSYYIYQNYGCHDTTPLVSFLDIGQGDSIFLRADDGYTVLIDTGPKDDQLISRIQEVTHCSKVHIHSLIITHPDADHIGEAERLIKKELIDEVLHNGFLDIDQANESLIENRLEEMNFKKRKISAGDVINHSNLKIEVLFPIGEAYSVSEKDSSKNKKRKKNKKPIHVDDNDYSLVIRVSIMLHGEQKHFMLTGDAPQKVEKEIIERYCAKSAVSNKNYCSALQSDILKLGHHGSKNSTASVFLEKVNPTEVVVSAGKNNSYHHPNEETMQRVKAFEVQSKKPLRIRETFTEGNIMYQ